MIDFLVKRFIKNYEDTGDSQVRMAYGIFVSRVGIGCNVFLFVLKLAVGLLVHSVSVMSDAFNNLSDAASSIISYIGVRMANRPADAGHPFGHGRIEYVSALIVSFLVIEVGFTLLKSSAGKILNPEPMTFHIVSVGILTASVSVKLWLAALNRILGRRIQSSVMKAAAADSMGDVLTTLSTVLALCVYGFWGINIDGLVGLIVSVIVMAAGVNIAKDTISPLLGEPVCVEVYKEITEFVESFDGIVGTHDLIVHNYGPSKSMASIHAEVPKDVDIVMSHEVIDRIEREAATHLGILLVIHMDPVAVGDERANHYRLLAEECIHRMDSRFCLHDFRVIGIGEHIRLIFDLVVPREYPDTQDAMLRERLNQLVREQDPRCCCAVTVERSFLAVGCEEEPEKTGQKVK